MFTRHDAATRCRDLADRIEKMHEEPLAGTFRVFAMQDYLAAPADDAETVDRFRINGRPFRSYRDHDAQDDLEEGRGFCGTACCLAGAASILLNLKAGKTDPVDLIDPYMGSHSDSLRRYLFEGLCWLSSVDPIVKGRWSPRGMQETRPEVGAGFLRFLADRLDQLPEAGFGSGERIDRLIEDACDDHAARVVP